MIIVEQKLDRVERLAPMLREPVLAFIQAARKDLGILLYVTHTYRSPMEQLKLYSQGRELRREEGVWVVVDKKRVVTNAQPGTSPHNVTMPTGEPASMAVDVIPVSQQGKLLLDTPRSDWEALWKLAWRFGLDPLGDAVGAYLAYDLGHFEEPAWGMKFAALGYILPTVSSESEQLV